VSVLAAAIFAALVCALFGGTADGPAHDHGADRARNFAADRPSARRWFTTMVQLVKKTGIDLRAAAAASQDGEASAQMLRPPLEKEVRADVPSLACSGCGTYSAYVSCVRQGTLTYQHSCVCLAGLSGISGPPPPAAWLGAQAGLSSERSARPLPVSVRAASGAAPVIFAAPLVVKRPRAHAASSCAIASNASRDTPVGGHYSGGRRAGAGMLPTCMLPPPLP
jgi:hypothetical protein